MTTEPAALTPREVAKRLFLLPRLTQAQRDRAVDTIEQAIRETRATALREAAQLHLDEAKRIEALWPDGSTLDAIEQEQWATRILSLLPVSRFFAWLRGARCDACKRRMHYRRVWLCVDCSCDWYDNGIVHRAELKARRESGVRP